ncbi:LCP family protein [Streptomyces sp. RB6PN25]|uniref:LCP family protein n=1 Tax=Streptomyces humicola TaxID=2953240 RepID=A0ABT1Q696_9ACTN|nr:LCP family protein [Streptomyces humicola]MCQ4084895.1 LCP family protein [Streptomyces humicola]
MTDVSHRRGGSATGEGTTVPGPRRARRAAQGAGRGGRQAGIRPGAEGRRAAGRGRARPRKRSAAKIAAITTSTAVLVVAGVGAALYEHLNGNINGLPLIGGGSEKADAFGRTPINILMLGSDGRDNAADCKIGGDCGGGENADVEMLVHVSADRSNATVMSVPRDTKTELPTCTDPTTHQTMQAHVDRINSTLQYGPSCTAAAVHQLTGIPVDHFMKVDFSGVVNMSDAIGGVPVCVSNNVYDPYSHLKLSKGTHTLKGMSALEFLRSRHGFGDGSDLGRTVSQHIFLSSMIRTLKSAGTLTDPTALYGLANAATKALTVDTGLDSIPKLLGLATDLNKVPSNRITFATMQTLQDPRDSSAVVPSSAAQNLFNALADDQSLSNGSGGKSSTATATPSPAQPAVPDLQITVQVNNGSGVTGRASQIAQDLIDQGFSPNSGSANAPVPASATSVHYAPGRQAEAQTVARALQIPASRLQQDSSVSQVTVVVGSDWSSGSTFPSSGGGSSRPAPADAKAAVAGANSSTADQSKQCAQVSTFDTVSVGGVPMTPTQAYADSPNVPNSAP